MFALLRRQWHPDLAVSLRTYATAAMLLMLLPLLGHAVVVTWLSYSTSRLWAERDLLSDAEHLARDIDVRLDVARTAMELVANSPAMQRGDEAGVRQLLGRLRAAGVILAAAVRGPAGEVVLGVGLPEGAARGISETEATGQPVAGRLAGEAVMVAALPSRSADGRLARLEFAVPVAVCGRGTAPTTAGHGMWPCCSTGGARSSGRLRARSAPAWCGRSSGPA